MLPREDREARVPEFKALCASLVEILGRIDHTPEEVERGFRVTTVNDNYREAG
jgi:hypothetical protein